MEHTRQHHSYVRAEPATRQAGESSLKPPGPAPAWDINPWRRPQALLSCADRLFTLDELKAALDAFSAFLTLPENRSSIAHEGVPAFHDPNQCHWIYQSLARVYPVKGDLLSFKERKRLNADRKRLLNLKLDVLSALSRAIADRDASRVWLYCRDALKRAPQGEDACFFLKLDRYYLGLNMRQSSSKKEFLHSGGLTDIFELIWHVERELSYGTFTKVREALPPGAIELKPGWNPKFVKHGIGEVKLIEHGDFNFQVTADSVFWKLFKGERFRAKFPAPGLLKWGQFLCQVHEALGIEVPGLTSEAVVTGKSIPVIFDTTENLWQSISTIGFVPSPTYQRILFGPSGPKPIQLTAGEAAVVQVLHQELAEHFGYDWVPENEILGALRKQGIFKQTLWDTLWKRSKTSEGKKPRIRGTALSEKLILTRGREPREYRLNI